MPSGPRYVGSGYDGGLYYGPTTTAVFPPFITTTELPTAVVGKAYSATPVAINGVEPYTWSVVAGSLPAGLSINASTGEISGTPTTRQSAAFTVQVEDDNQLTHSREFTIPVWQPSILPLDPSTLASLEHAYDARDLSLSNGDPVSTWADAHGSADLTQSGGVRPEYQTDVQNGLPGVYFNGTNRLESPASSLANLPGRTIITVLKLDSTSPPTANQAAVTGWTSAASRWTCYPRRSNSNGNQQGYWDNTNTWHVGRVLPLDQTHVLAWNYEASGDQRLHYNLVDGNAPRTMGSIPAHDRLVVGSREEGGNAENLKGWIMHILVFDETLPRSTRERVERWLSDIWDPEDGYRYVYSSTGERSSGVRDFGGDTLNAQPPNTTERWFADGDFEVKAEAEAENGRALVLTIPSPSNVRALSLDELDGFVDIEILSRMKSSINIAPRAQISTRARDTLDGSDRPTHQGVSRNRGDGSNFWELRMGSGGGPGWDLNYPSGIPVTEWYFQRHSQIGDVWRFKGWAGSVADEPAEWTAVLESFVFDGWHGVGGFTTADNPRWDWIVWGVNGAQVVRVGPPLAPTVDASAVGSNIFASTGTMAPGSSAGGNHTATRWQVRLATDSDWDTPVVDLTTSEFLTTVILEGLAEETAYHVRAAHADDGVFGGFSAHVSVTTGLDIPIPNKPVVESPVEEVGVDFVTATVSEFSHAEGTTTQEEFDGDEPLPYLLTVEWQVQVSGGDWSSPVYSEEVAIALLEDPLRITVTGLGDDTTFQIRARQRDGHYGTQSPWSDPVTFTTPAIPAERPDQPTITLVACSWEGMQVTADEMTHPDGSAVHAASEWRACQTSCAGAISTSQLQAFEWFSPTEGTWALSVRYRDDSGRWGDWSEPVSCDIDPPPPQVVVSSPVGGSVISADTVIQWEVPAEPPSGSWAYTLEVSEDNGETWEELFSGSATEYLFTILGRPNGTYRVRVRACYEDSSHCGDWFYLTLTIDRTGVSAVSYDFTQLDELPATWQVFWDGQDHGVLWELVDRDLQTEGAPIGVLARHILHNTQRRSNLGFTELGKPRLGRFTTQFAVMGREDIWYFWRYTHTHMCRGGLGYAITGTRTDLDRDGLQHTVSTGVAPWPCPTRACGCTFMPESTCLGCRSATLDRSRDLPNTVWSYGTSYRQSGVSRLQFFDGPTNFFLRTGAALPFTGSRTRGMVVGTRDEVPEDPEQPDLGTTCVYRPIWYTMEKVVDRVGDDLRIRVKVMGPGIQPAGWHLTTTIKPEDFRFNDGCGYCGLSFDQLRGLDQTIGILFRSFSAELPEGFQVSGPLYGTPTVEVGP